MSESVKMANSDQEFSNSFWLLFVFRYERSQFMDKSLTEKKTVKP